MELRENWEFWADAEGAGESIGVFLPGGGTGVEPYWAKGWPGDEQRPARTPDWHPITVPGHWQAQGYAGYQGDGWYRLRFTPEPREGRPFLLFEGVDFYADVWLNGDYLGFHEGDFDAFALDVTTILRAEEENLLVVRVAAPLENPAGIWRPVRVEYRGDLHVESVRVTPMLGPDYAWADLAVEVAVENYGAGGAVPVRLTLAGHNFVAEALPGLEATLLIPPGHAVHTLHLRLDRPALWWSWDQGFPHLYRLAVTLGAVPGGVAPGPPAGTAPAGQVGGGVPGAAGAPLAGAALVGQPVAVGSAVFGVREFRKEDDWALYLNGRRFFARGTNYLGDRFLSLMTPERYRQDVELMRGANMNMVRVFAHLEQEEFYRFCNEQGMMVFQDLPFQWGYEASGLFIQRAAEIARRAVRQVYNHPAVVLLCAHSEPRIHDFNKLDEVLLRTIVAVDRTRPVIKSSVLVEQAAYTREHLEALRRKKYHGVNGLLQFLFVDNGPAITWAILDYDRVPRPAYQVVADAFAPLLLTFTLHPERGELAVWVVNDYHQVFAGLTLQVNGQTQAMPEVRADEAAIYAKLPVAAGVERLELDAALADAHGQAVASWRGELTPHLVPEVVEQPSIV